jgi:hypothetical protein
MSRPVKRGVGKKIPKSARRAPRPIVPAQFAILDQGDDLDHLYNLFGVTDDNDIRGVVDGSVGDVSEDW